MSSIEPLLPRFRTWLVACGGWCVLLCLFFVPINKPATNIFIALALICSLLGAQALQRWREALRYPVVLGTLAWWAVLAVSVLYAPPVPGLWRGWLGNIALAYPLIVVSLFGHDDRWRVRAMWTFGLSMALVLLLSWGQFAGVVPQRALVEHYTALKNTPFKEYTQQGIETMVFCAMLASVALAWPRQRRVAWLLFGILAGLASVLLAIQSRTALVTLVPLLLLWGVFLFRRSRWGRVGMLVLVLGAVLGMGATWQFSQTQRDRVIVAYSQALQGLYTREANSVGVRMEVWRQSARIIEKSPWIGHGFDQWHPQFEVQTKDEKDYGYFRMRFPHQEYLLILAEQGIVGFAIYCALLLALALYIWRLPQPWRHFYASILLIYLTAGLANSLWPDFTHRHLFALWLACIPWLPRTAPEPPAVADAALAAPAPRSDAVS